MPELHKKQAMWQPHSWTWKLMLRLLPPIIWQFLAVGNNFATNPQIHMARKSEINFLAPNFQKQYSNVATLWSAYHCVAFLVCVLCQGSLHQLDFFQKIFYEDITTNGTGTLTL